MKRKSVKTGEKKQNHLTGKAGRKRTPKPKFSGKTDLIVGWVGEDMLFRFDGFIYK